MKILTIITQKSAYGCLVATYSFDANEVEKLKEAIAQKEEWVMCQNFTCPDTWELHQHQDEVTYDDLGIDQFEVLDLAVLKEEFNM